MNERSTKILNKFKDLFKNYCIIEGLTIDIQLEKDTKPIQQKGRPVPIYYQNSEQHDLEKLIKRASGESRRNDRKLYCLTGFYNHEEG